MGQYKKIDNLDRIIVATDYNNRLVASLIHSFKYQFITDLGDILSDYLVEAVKDSLLNYQYDFVVPVPLSRKRKLWRSFNQSDVLAKKISQKFHLVYKPDLLVRSYNVSPQVGSSAKVRKSNVKGVFKINKPTDLKNKKILLVDDVITSGATVGECAKILKSAGAEQVTALAIAQG